MRTSLGSLSVGCVVNLALHWGEPFSFTSTNIPDIADGTTLTFAISELYLPGGQRRPASALLLSHCPIVSRHVPSLHEFLLLIQYMYYTDFAVILHTFQCALSVMVASSALFYGEVLFACTVNYKSSTFP